MEKTYDDFAYLHRAVRGVNHKTVDVCIHAHNMFTVGVYMLHLAYVFR